MRTLDRYVLRSWILIFSLTALGFPVVSLLINMTENLPRLLDRGLHFPAILLSYVYAMPAEIAQVMPAAVLFATVFTVGNLGRHSELTAAKAGGYSFYRLAFPLFVAASFAVALAYLVGELAESTSRKLELQKAKAARPRTARYNFVFRADQGWVYTIRSLDIQHSILRQLVFERQGRGPDYPNLAITADSATYVDSLSSWVLWSGTSQRMMGDGEQRTFSFQSARLRALTQQPADLLAERRRPRRCAMPS
jgi:lipopolysaccharide export system permease protein